MDGDDAAGGLDGDEAGGVRSGRRDGQRLRSEWRRSEKAVAGQRANLILGKKKVVCRDSLLDGGLAGEQLMELEDGVNGHGIAVLDVEHRGVEIR
nr:hypothetical protein Iba_chr03cCG0450 [Ipomoea batatas]